MPYVRDTMPTGYKVRIKTRSGAVIKEWRCSGCELDFESVLPLCPECKRTKPTVRRAFRTAPKIASTAFNNINDALSDVLPSQHLSNYSNATGYPKPTFDGIYQNDSGMVAGFGINNLSRLIPDVPKGQPLARMDLETGQRQTVDVESWAAKLPQAISVPNGAQVGVARNPAGLGGKTIIQEVGAEKGRYKG